MCDILVVDDDQSIREFMERALSFDNNVRVAKSEKEALEEAKNKPDVVLLDMKMDHENSGERLIDTGAFRGCAIIVVTASDLTEDGRADLMEKGVFDVIIKPFNNRVLTEKIKRAYALHCATRNMKPTDSTIINLQAAQKHFGTARDILSKFL